MLEELWNQKKPSGLLSDALEEICRMLKQEEIMFQAASQTFLTGQKPAIDVVKEDKIINKGERTVRRLVAQHLALNPEQDLPSSLVLISIVHDVERIGDYTKSLVELSQFRPVDLKDGQYAKMCAVIANMIHPMMKQTLSAFRDSDENIARAVMNRNREVNICTDNLIEDALTDSESGREAMFYCIGARILRRISGHLSNIASGIADPFDLLGSAE